MFGSFQTSKYQCDTSSMPYRSTRCRAKLLIRSPHRAQSFGGAGQYETYSGTIQGEVDPSDRRNAIIQDLQLAPRNARGMVEYTATFFLTKPIDMSKSSGVLFQEVPNRGGRIDIGGRATGDVGLSSGWPDREALGFALAAGAAAVSTSGTARVSRDEVESRFQAWQRETCAAGPPR